jgi:hypothetical protein
LLPSQIIVVFDAGLFVDDLLIDKKILSVIGSVFAIAVAAVVIVVLVSKKAIIF